ncbi:lysosome membrane protein 2-like [Pollicipes pollicipes]|uniref:lysosome membrane protein 2-like n=1 Tax=Pollicipes pollicipes TaxID=41117 RepID=UPI00188583FC|nr:lysosome membrane protein 2-like [Pollicipes pollicipes]
MARDGHGGWLAVPTYELAGGRPVVARRARLALCCRTCCPGCALVTGLLLLVVCLLAVIFMQAYVEAYVNKMLAFSEDSPTFQSWKKSPIPIKQNVYFFNLTNKEEFLNGLAKPRVQQVGPYVIGQKKERRDIAFHPNGTLSARLVTKLFFIWEDSAGSETDLITTINVPMILAAEKARFQPPVMRRTISATLEALGETPIITKSVRDLVSGYPDPLLKLANDMQPPRQNKRFDKFGFFIKKNNSIEQPMLINTGQSDWRRIGVIERYDGSRTLPFWNTRQCNMINGSGGIYPPGAHEGTTLYAFARQLCRSLPLLFEKQVLHSKVRTLRFTPPEDVFDSVDTKPENMCYCVGGPPCAPKGLFNTSICQNGSPTFISFPHFYLADPSIPAKLDGLRPRKEEHQFFMDIVPRLGTMMKAKIRIQMNFKIGPVQDILYTQSFPDMYYPVFWMEGGVDQLPAEAIKKVQRIMTIVKEARTKVTRVTLVLGSALALYGAAVLLSRMRQKRRAESNDKPEEVVEVAAAHGGAPTNGAAPEKGVPQSV